MKARYFAAFQIQDWYIARLRWRRFASYAAVVSESRDSGQLSSIQTSHGRSELSIVRLSVS